MTTYEYSECAKINSLDELRSEDANEMRAQRLKLCKEWHNNTPYQIFLVNPEGTRYILACRSNDFNGYGCTASCWLITYGAIGWYWRKDITGEFYAEWRRTNKVYGRSKNGTEIPRSVHTKAEVIELIKRIGIFDI